MFLASNHVEPLFVLRFDSFSCSNFIELVVLVFFLTTLLLAGHLSMHVLQHCGSGNKEDANTDADETAAGKVDDRIDVQQTASERIVRVILPSGSSAEGGLLTEDVAADHDEENE